MDLLCCCFCCCCCFYSPRWRLRGPRWPCVLARCRLRGPRWPCALSRCVRVFAPWPIGHMFSLGDYIRLLWLLVSFGFPRISLRCFSLSLVLSFVFFLSYPSLYVSFLFTDVFTSPMWAELNHVEDPSLRRLAEKLPEVVLGSRADNTTLSYLNGFKRWRSWACKFPEITVLPATPAYVSLYLLSVLQASTSPAPVQTAFYSIRWAHEIAGFESPTSHTLPQRVLESAKRRLSHQVSKKLPVTPEILLKFHQSLDGSLVDTRFMAMALLAFAGFLKFDELSSLKLKDVVSHATYFELFIESSKTDQYREALSFPLLRRAQSYVPGSISLIIYLRPKSLCSHLPLVVTILFLVTSKQSLAVNLFAWGPRYLIPGVGKCYLRS